MGVAGPPHGICQVEFRCGIEPRYETDGILRLGCQEFQPPILPVLLLGWLNLREGIEYVYESAPPIGLWITLPSQKAVVRSIRKDPSIRRCSLPRKLEQFPVAGTRRYPWDEWLNGEVWQLFKGEDYTSKTATILSNARIQAKRLGGSVRTRTLTDEGRESLVLQFQS